jgi:curved DNA-binding protein CbpA
MPVNYYAILGIAENASAEEIRRAYREAAMALHPDRGGSDRLMRRINEAWEVLSNPQKRHAYDAQRHGARRSTRAAGRSGAQETKPGGRQGPTGRRPPTLARIAGSLVGRAFSVIGKWMEPERKAGRKAAKNRGAVIVRCVRCGQKLRVRVGTSERIRCPRCRHWVVPD